MSEPKNLVIKVKRTTPDLNSAEPPQMVSEWNYKRIAGALVILLMLIGLCIAWVSEPDKVQTWLQDLATKTAPMPPTNATPPAAAPIITPLPTPAPNPTPAPATEPAPSALDAAPPAAPAATLTPKPPAAPAPTPVVPAPPAAPAAKPVATAPAAAHPETDTPAPAAKASSRAPAADTAKPEIPVTETKPDNAFNAGKITRASLTYHLADKEPADLIEGPVALGNIPTTIYYFTEIQNMKGQPLSHEWWKNGQRVMHRQLTVTTDKWRGDTQRQLNANDAGFWKVRTVDGQGILLNEIAFTVSPR